VRLRQSREEDDLVVQLVGQYGAKNWSFIAKHLPGRIGKQCRERWHNHLCPNINKEKWSAQEDSIILEAHRRYDCFKTGSATSGR
jgi:hypothetical protein